MDDSGVRGESADLTRSERWAAYVAAHVSGPVGAIVALAIAVLFAVEAATRGDAFLWGMVAVMLGIALLYWERGGFKRLLARRDREIERLRSSGRPT